MLDGVLAWDGAGIRCWSRRHLHEGNPLRRRDRLAAVTGAEFCLQAAALHGALCAGARLPAGAVVSLRAVVLGCDRLDDPELGTLTVEAMREAAGPGGLGYALLLRSASGQTLLSARATVRIPLNDEGPGDCAPGPSIDRR